jgi:hypothetical protein
MRIIQHESVSQLALPPDFAAFLNEIPAGFDFNLWNLQGAMRFTREGVSAAQTFERELKSAQELRLIRETAEDRAFTDRCRKEYGSSLRYGATYIKEAALN